MVIVLIAQRINKILEWIFNKDYESIEYIGIIKKEIPRVYLYVRTSLSYDEVEGLFKKSIVSQGGAAYVYQFYSIWRGLIDYMPYLSDKKKLQNKYYQQNKKDITEEEIETFLKEH